MKKLDELIDKKERRWSISSACSSLTDLSTDSYEEEEGGVPEETERRRLSISSTCSTSMGLLALSEEGSKPDDEDMLEHLYSDDENMQMDLSQDEHEQVQSPPKVIPKVRLTLSSTTNLDEELESDDEDAPMDLPSDELEPVQEPPKAIRRVRLTLSSATNLPAPLTTPFDANPPTTACNGRSGTAVRSKKKVKKGRKRRQVKKQKTVPPPIERVQHKQPHRRKRMLRLHAHNIQMKSKSARITAKLVERALKAIEIVDCELDQLRTARVTAHEKREYRHEELEALGIRTIRWNGR